MKADSSRAAAVVKSRMEDEFGDNFNICAALFGLAVLYPDWTVRNLFALFL
jgi:hypothetical protein